MASKDYYAGQQQYYPPAGPPQGQGQYYPQPPPNSYAGPGYGQPAYGGGPGYPAQPPPQTVYVQQPRQGGGVGGEGCLACLAGACLCCCAEEALCDCLF